MSDFGSGHDLMVGEFEPHVRLYADSSEPGAHFRFCLLLSLPTPPLLVLCLCLSKIKKCNKKKNFKKRQHICSQHGLPDDFRPTDEPTMAQRKKIPFKILPFTDDVPGHPGALMDVSMP